MNLTKMFVLVPASSSATVDTIKTTSSSNNNIYFMAKYNQIVAKGIAYGIDPVTAKEIKTTITALGASVADDGTVTVDFSDTNYASTVDNAVAAIKALDSKIKTEMDKLATSKTLDKNYEVTARVNYHAATSDKAAYIALETEPYVHAEGEEAKADELSVINISDIIGNGVIDHSSYDSATGTLHLFFKTAKEGEYSEVTINLAELFDIDDITIASDSADYLKVSITTGTDITSYTRIESPFDTITVAEYKALTDDEKAKYAPNYEKGFELGTKVVKVSDASDTKTGLVDANDVKKYIASQTSDLQVEAEGDDYVSAYVDSANNNKKVWVSTDVRDVTASAGTRGTWSVTDEGVATLNGEVAPTISGVAKSLVDGEQSAAAVKTYVDAKVAAEAAERAAKIDAAIKALDVDEAEITGKSESTNNVHFTYSETDGKIALKDIFEDYATVTPTATTSTQTAPKTDAAIAIAKGDNSKLVKASDLVAAVGVAADKATEVKDALNYRIDNLAGDVTSDDATPVTVQITTSKGEVSDVVVTTNSAGVHRTGDAKDARVLAYTVGTGAIVGSDINLIKGYVDDKVADATTDLTVSATGDSYVSAYVDASDNKHVYVYANPGTLTVTAVAGTDSTISGDAKKFVAGDVIADKVSKFVNARIDEEIKKLDVVETDITNGNVHLTYSETDGIVALSGLSLDYTTTAVSKDGEADTKFVTSDKTKIATGADVQKAADFTNTRIAEEIDKLDVASTNVAETGEGRINFNYSETDGIVKIDTLGVTYSEYTANDKGSGTITTGIVSGTELTKVLADMWETYVDA
jgi:uncharacterized protein YaaR (DUF327 family)